MLRTVLKIRTLQKQGKILHNYLNLSAFTNDKQISSQVASGLYNINSHTNIKASIIGPGRAQYRINWQMACKSLFLFSTTKKLSQQSSTGEKPLHFQVMQRKLNLPNPKLDQLQRMLIEDGLQQYFNSKSPEELTLVQIYFYLKHRETLIFFQSKIHLIILTKAQIDAFSCFVFAHESGLIDNYRKKLTQQKSDSTVITRNPQQVNIQGILSKVFNQQCRQMSKQQLIYCLSKISQFMPQNIEKLIYFQAIKLRLVQYNTGNVDYEYLQILYLLKKICMRIDTIKFNAIVPMYDAKQLVKALGQRIQHQLREIRKINKFAHNPQTQTQSNYINIKYLFFLRVLQDQFNLHLSLDRLSLRQKIVEKKMSTIRLQQQQYYTIRLLQFYNKFTYIPNFEKFSIKNYIYYLKHIQKQMQQKQNYQILNHPIPQAIYSQCTSQQFEQIIELRVRLGLQKTRDLGKLVKNIMNKHNLACIIGLIEYLHINQPQNNEVWYQFQRNFIAKLNLSRPRLKRNTQNIQNIIKQYDIILLLQTISSMSLKKLGSTFYWKYCYRFMHDLLIDDNLIKDIPSQNQNKFIIYVFNIYGLNTIPEYIEQKLIKLSLITLSNNRWSLKQFGQLIGILAYSKFGCDQLWYAIQNKLSAKYLKTQRNLEPKSQKILAKIYRNFQMMNFKSFRLVSKFQRLQKFQIIPNQQQLVLMIQEQKMVRERKKQIKKQENLKYKQMWIKKQLKQKQKIQPQHQHPQI